MKRLTRKQVAQGLETVPLDVVLLGAAGAKDQRLTSKQREFARQMALGQTKAGSYRAAYKTKAKPQTASRRGVELASSGKIKAQIEAFRVAIEAQKYATPAHLRALVIERLTAAAIDEAIAPAQRLRALELLGKVTEVAAFTERREVVHVQDASQIRERLINSLRLALAASGAIDAAPARVSKAIQADPPPHDPPDAADACAPPLLSNPHNGSTTIDKPNPNCAPSVSTQETVDKNLSVTGVTLTLSNEINDLDPKCSLTSPGVTAVTDANVSIGGVGAKVSGGFESGNPGTPPVNDLVPSGNWK